MVVQPPDYINFYLFPLLGGCYVYCVLINVLNPLHRCVPHTLASRSVLLLLPFHSPPLSRDQILIHANSPHHSGDDLLDSYRVLKTHLCIL